MRLLFVSWAIGAIVVPIAASALASEPLDLFDSESAARRHCGSDIVVWLDVPSNRFSLKSEPGYRANKNGGYTCEKDALRAGNRQR